MRFARDLVRFLTGLVAVIVAVIAAFAAFVSVVVLVVILVFHPGSTEVSRSVSPDNQRDAIVVETNGGATTDFGYEIYVVPRGRSWRWSRRIALLYGAHRSDGAYGVSLRWESPRVLLAEFQTARSSRVERASVNVAGQSVELRLREETSD